MTTTSQTIMRQQARLKGIQAREMRSLGNRQSGDNAGHELTARNLEYARDVLLKDAKYLDAYYNGVAV
jgi:hypothetical protein